LRKEKVRIIDEPLKFGSTAPVIVFVEDPDGTFIEIIKKP